MKEFSVRALGVFLFLFIFAGIAYWGDHKKEEGKSLAAMRERLSAPVAEAGMSPFATQDLRAGEISSFAEIVPDNVLLFTPIAPSERDREDQLDDALRRLADKYRILSVAVTYRQQGTVSPHYVLGSVRIVVEPKDK